MHIHVKKKSGWRGVGGGVANGRGQDIPGVGWQATQGVSTVHQQDQPQKTICKTVHQHGVGT